MGHAIAGFARHLAWRGTKIAKQKLCFSSRRESFEIRYVLSGL